MYVGCFWDKAEETVCFLKKQLLNFYLFIYGFEKFFSQRPMLLFSVLTQKGSDRELLKLELAFETALKMKQVSPEKSRSLFYQLLFDMQKVKRLPFETLHHFQGRIYYHLGTLSNQSSEQLKYYQNCIELVPGHSKAKDRYSQLEKQR